jgi:hypothetical protein
MRAPNPSSSNVAPTAAIHRSPVPTPVEASAPELEVAPTGLDASTGDAAAGADGDTPEEPVDAGAATKPAPVVVVPSASVADEVAGGATGEDGLRDDEVVGGVPGVVVGLVSVVGGAAVDVVVVEAVCEQMAV